MIAQMRCSHQLDLFRGTYGTIVLARPLTVKFFTSLVCALLSNLVSQLPSGRLDWACALKYGLLDAPPHSHFWCVYLFDITSWPLANIVRPAGINCCKTACRHR
jgi:hypothetical protein|eukprot:COSAG01_NODE_8265_length_2851_cov_19.265262_1_plen_104_part_00